MSSPQSGSPDSSFQARLNKVAERRAPIDASKPEVPVIPDWKENFKYPAALVGSFFVGMLAVFIARYARFHLMGGSLAGEDADIAMLLDGGIAAACSFALFSMLRFHDAQFKAAQSFGVAAMVLFMHNFVHLSPGVFGAIFSDEWAEEVVAATEPNSILFRGASFVLYTPKEETAEKAPLPKVRRIGS